MLLCSEHTATLILSLVVVCINIFYFWSFFVLNAFTLIFQGNCTFREDLRIFNCTYPSAGNPYTLDLTEPYKAAVLEELLVSVSDVTVFMFCVCVCVCVCMGFLELSGGVLLVDKAILFKTLCLLSLSHANLFIFNRLNTSKTQSTVPSRT